MFHRVARLFRQLSAGATRPSPPSPAVAPEPAPAPAEVTTAMMAASGLFDPSFYLIAGPDVREAGLDPLQHFREWGWREGRRPNLYFDPLWYADRYLGGTGSTIDPLAHYIGGGEQAGCRPIAFFDPAWYRATYAPPEGHALAHFLLHRRSQRVAPNPQFDLVFYLDRHGREIGPNRDPFAHLLRCGATRDLDPSPAFDSAAYRRQHMAAAPAAGAGQGAQELQVPLVHYLDALTRYGSASSSAIRGASSAA